MACGLGGAQRAEASYLLIQTSGQDYSFGYNYSSFIVDTSGAHNGHGTFTDRVEEDSDPQYAIYIYRVDAYNVSLDVIFGHNNSANGGKDYTTVNLTVYSGSETHSSTGNPMYEEPPYKYSNTILNPILFSFSFDGSNILGHHDVYDTEPAYIDISTVPLPPTLALFGCSLLCLGGIGYANLRGNGKAA